MSYIYEEKLRAVQLYIENYFSPSSVIYEIGYPSRNRLIQWYREVYSYNVTPFTFNANSTQVKAHWVKKQ